MRETQNDHRPEVPLGPLPQAIAIDNPKNKSTLGHCQVSS